MKYSKFFSCSLISSSAKKEVRLATAKVKTNQPKKVKRQKSQNKKVKTERSKGKKVKTKKGLGVVEARLSFFVQSDKTWSAQPPSLSFAKKPAILTHQRNYD